MDHPLHLQLERYNTFYYRILGKHFIVRIEHLADVQPPHPIRGGGGHLHLLTVLNFTNLYVFGSFSYSISEISTELNFLKTAVMTKEGVREAAWPSGQGGGLGIRQPGFNSRPVLVTRQSRVSSPRPRL